VIDGQFPLVTPTADFFRRLQLNKPSYSGWSLWHGDYSLSSNSTYPFQDGWESFMAGTPLKSEGFDFWRAEVAGHFYHIRMIWDDCTNGVEPQTQLDFVLHTRHVTEAVSIGAYFARILGCDETATTIGFACRWSKLKGRVLHSWSDPQRGFVSPAAVQDEQTTSVAMPLETPPPAFAPVVESLVGPLFAVFGGTKFESMVIEQIVRATLSRPFR